MNLDDVPSQEPQSIQHNPEDENYSEQYKEPRSYNHSLCDTQDYILAKGALVTALAGKEAKYDFTLKDNPFKERSIISGVVKDCRGKGIIDVLVKVLDQQHKPVTHTFTNEDGEFLICIPPGTYIIKAVR